MKKLFLSVALLTVVALTSQAQTEKGKFILGGTASYESVKSESDGANANQGLTILPNIGYFIADNIAIGTGIGYNYSNIGEASTIGQTEAFIVSPFGRHYTNLGEKFKFFGQVQVPLAFGNVKETDANGDSGSKTGSTTAIGVNLSPGFAYYPTKKIGIELAFSGFSYNNLKTEDGNGNKIDALSTNSFAIGTNFFSPKIGIQFHF